jgi:hypothetical protein
MRSMNILHFIPNIMRIHMIIKLELFSVPLITGEWFSMENFELQLKQVIESEYLFLI